MALLQQDPKEGINAVQVSANHCSAACESVECSTGECEACFNPHQSPPTSPASAHAHHLPKCHALLEQTVRNQVLATSILAASTAPLIASLVNVITDGAKLDQIEEYSAVDPITDSTVVRVGGRGRGEEEGRKRGGRGEEDLPVSGMCLEQRLARSAIHRAPVARCLQISPPVRLGIAIGLLFFSIMSFAQSVRLSVHVGKLREQQTSTAN